MLMNLTVFWFIANEPNGFGKLHMGKLQLYQAK